MVYNMPQLQSPFNSVAVYQPYATKRVIAFTSVRRSYTSQSLSSLLHRDSRAVEDSPIYLPALAEGYGYLQRRKFNGRERH